MSRVGFIGSMNFILFIVFLVLKLTKTVDWSWWIITLHLWMGFVVFVFCMIIFFIGMIIYMVCLSVQEISVPTKSKRRENGINRRRTKGKNFR